jgi:hypothetical protein|tara:strand:- start:4537 stop:4929 length:393 start_codon:yes stop_codon:yes gene_type:complete
MVNKFIRILSFFIFPALVFLVNLPLGFVYEIYPWFDIPMHFLGGVSIAFTSVLFLRLFEEKKMLKIRDEFLFLFVVTCFVAFVAVLWEFYELIVLVFFDLKYILGIEDTLLDLAMGLLGGFFGAAIFRKL